MNPFRQFAELAAKIAMCRVSFRQIGAATVLLAVMMPITVPIPAWAYGLDPAPAAPGSSDIALRPTRDDRSTIASFLARTSGLLESISALLSTESTNYAKDVSTEGEEIGEAPVEGPDVAATRKSSATGGSVRSSNDALHSVPSGSLGALNLLEDDDEQAVRDSTYSSENNVGQPAGKTEMDSPNVAAVSRIRHRAGVANYSFDVPIASLPGRGMDASIGITYNSRIWNKTGTNPAASYTYNVDNNWLAPGFTLGFGKLTSHFSSKTILLTNNQYKTFNHVVPDGYTDPDGTRHQIECKVTSVIPNTQSSFDNTYCTEYGTVDGTFVKVLYHGSRPLSAYLQDDFSAYAQTYFTLIHSDGSRMVYSVPGGQYGAGDYSREHYPETIQDRNGNQINIAYRSGGNTIDYIRDTLGRDIKFYYESATSTKLVAVTRGSTAAPNGRLSGSITRMMSRSIIRGDSLQRPYSHRKPSGL